MADQDGLQLTIEARAAIAQLDALEGRLRRVGSAIGAVGNTPTGSSRGMDQMAGQLANLERQIAAFGDRTNVSEMLFSQRDVAKMRQNLDAAKGELISTLSEMEAHKKKMDVAGSDPAVAEALTKEWDALNKKAAENTRIIKAGTRAIQDRHKAEAEQMGMSMKYYMPNEAQAKQVHAEAIKLNEQRNRSNMDRMHKEALNINKEVKNTRKGLEDRRKLEVMYAGMFDKIERDRQARKRTDMKVVHQEALALNRKITSERNEAAKKALQYDKDYTEGFKINADRRLKAATKVLNDQIRMEKMHTLALQENARKDVADTRKKISIGEKLTKQEEAEIRRVNELLRAKRELTTAERAYASALNISTAKIKSANGVLQTHQTTLEGIRLTFSRLRNLVLVYSFILRPMVRMLQSSVNAFKEFEQATLGVTSVAAKFGIEGGRVKDVLTEVTRDGLVPVTDASKALTKLLSTGIGLPLATKLLNSFKQSAAFNRQGILSMGEALVGASQGFKNLRSQLVDNAGITKNLSIILKEQAAILGVRTSKLNDLQKYQLIANGLIQEAALYEGDAARAAASVAGQFDKMNISIEIASRSFGEFLATQGWVKAFTDNVISMTAALEKLGKTMKGTTAFEYEKSVLNALPADSPLVPMQQQTVRGAGMKAWKDAPADTFAGRGLYERTQKRYDFSKGKAFEGLITELLGVDVSNPAEMRRVTKEVGVKAAKYMADIRALSADVVQYEAAKRHHVKTRGSLGTWNTQGPYEELIPFLGIDQQKEMDNYLGGISARLAHLTGNIMDLPGVRLFEKPKEEKKEPEDFLRRYKERIRDTANLSTAADKYARRLESFQKSLNSVYESAKKNEDVTDEMLDTLKSYGAGQLGRLTEFVTKQRLDDAREMLTNVQMASDVLSGKAMDPYDARRRSSRAKHGELMESFKESFKLRTKGQEGAAFSPEEVASWYNIDVALAAAIDKINDDEIADKFNEKFNDILKKARLGSRESTQKPMGEFMIGLMGDIFDKTKGDVIGFDSGLMDRLHGLQNESAQRVIDIQNNIEAAMKATSATAMSEVQENKLRAAKLTEEKTLRTELTQAVNEYIDTWLRSRGIENDQTKTQVDNLKAVAEGFGAIASAAAFASRIGEDSLTNVAYRARATAGALQSATEAIGKFKAIESGAGILANSASAMGGFASLAMVGMQTYQAIRGESEEEKERRRKSRDFGATINRGPQTINYNPTMVIQADGSVYFSQDSMEVVIDEQRRLLQEAQEFGELAPRGAN